MPVSDAYLRSIETFLADQGTWVEMYGAFDSISNGDYGSAAISVADTALTFAEMIAKVPGWASFSLEAAQLTTNANALYSAVSANDPDAIRTKIVAVLGNTAQLAGLIGLGVAAAVASPELAVAAGFVGMIGIHAGFASQVMQAQDRVTAKQVAEIGAYYLTRTDRFGDLAWKLDDELYAIKDLRRDAPALFTAVATLKFLDPTLTFGAAKRLVLGASNAGQIQDSSEALAEIQRTFFGQHPQVSTTNATFFQQADDLFRVLRYDNGALRFREWPSQSLIETDASYDQQLRAAALLGSPFIVDGADYAPRLSGSSLDTSLYDSATGIEGGAEAG